VKDMGLIEHYGTGIRRVRRIFTEYGLPEPEFTVIANGFLVKVLGTQPELENQDNMAHNFVVRPVDEGKINDGVTDRVTDRVDVTENQKAIIRLIEGKSTITSEEIASIIGISDRKIKENIKKLKGLGLLKRVGPDRGGHWQIIENK
jgi:ATP-dependent DNA helicase RecG